MMKKIFVRLMLVLAAVGVIVGCKTAPVYNVEQQTIVANVENVEMDDIKKAIVRAGASLNWVMRVDQPGHIVGTLHLRSHMAQVDIKYSNNSYSITYKDSQNLKYDDATGTIHGQYNVWVQNLQRKIDVQLSTLNM